MWFGFSCFSRPAVCASAEPSVTAAAPLALLIDMLTNDDIYKAIAFSNVPLTFSTSPDLSTVNMEVQATA